MHIVDKNFEEILNGEPEPRNFWEKETIIE